MIDAARLVFALGLPWVTGALFVCLFWQARRPGFRLAVAGLAFPIGMVGVILGYCALDVLGFGLSFGWNTLLQLVAACCFAVIAWSRRRRLPVDPLPVPERNGEWQSLSRGTRWLVAAVLAWLALRGLGMIVEVMHRPLFPWDAWYAYGAQAKVWFHAGRLDVFANNMDWFQSGEPVWAAGGVRHPPGIGLIQLWMAQCLGRWDDALINLPWPAVYFSHCLMLVGLARLAGVSLPTAVVWAWLAMSAPIIGTQAVLAGYGDLWISVYLLAAAGGCMLMIRGKDAGLACVVAAALVGLLLIKQVGLFWLCVVGLSVLASRLTLSGLLKVVAAGLVASVGVLWWLGEPVTVGILGQYGFDEGAFVFPGYIPMWSDLIAHLFVYSNWHLFWYLVVLSLPFLVPMCRRDERIRFLASCGMGGVVALIVLFAVSDLGHAVIDGSSVNRLLLHPVATLGLCLSLMTFRWLSKAGATR